MEPTIQCGQHLAEHANISGSTFRDVNLLGAESHAEYPRALREIPDPPGLLFVRGTLKPADALGIGIVGTCHGTAYGLLSFYACVETQSMPWAVGYGAVAIASAVVAARHLLARMRPSP